jgi:hypothetical protein
MARKKYYRWSAMIQRETLPELRELAEGLGFLVTATGGLKGNPSPAAFLDALAAAYLNDPDALKSCLRSAGVAADKVNQR